MARKLSTPVSILLVVGALVAVVAMAVVASNARSKERRAGVDAAISQAIAATKSVREQRPVLRGDPVDGNAWEAQALAVQALAPDRDALAEVGDRLKGTDPLPEAQLALAAAKAPELATLREAARRSWTWNAIDVAQGFAAPTPDYKNHLAATKLLVLLAEQRRGMECLQITADALRLSQDRIPGAGLLASMVSAAETRLIARAVLRCALRATREERAAATAEFERLVDARPSFGETMELEAIACAVELRRQADMPLPLSVGVNGPSALYDRMRLDSAMELLVGEFGKWREAARAGPPASIAATTALLEARLAETNGLLDLATPNIDKYVHREAEALALQRGVILALAAMETVPPMTPGRIVEKKLADPFTGRPFLLHLATEKAPARLCSVGPDGVDGIGDPASDDVCLELH